MADRKSSPEGRTVLLTGATGFLGGALLAQGLECGYAERWICVARGGSTQQARARVLGNLARYLPGGLPADAERRIEIVAGDITDSGTFRNGRIDGVTHVFHLAADTSYRSKVVNRLVNVTGTQNVADFARTQPHLRRFVYAGTAMICGRNSRPVVREDEFPSDLAEHVVHYTQTKADAETILRSAYGDLPTLVVRPSIVAGHSRLGARPSASIYWMFRAGDRLRVVSGDPDGGIDVVPVDWVADTILELARRDTLAADTYHLSAGLRNRTTWRALAAAFEAVEPTDGRRDYDRIATGDWRRLRQRFDAVFGLDAPIKIAMLRAMRAYYEFSALDVAFCNRRLLAEGIAPPPALPDYLATCLGSMPGMSIEAQFADDLGMFEAGGTAEELRAVALTPA
jgi:nucleoside-diphosphate-sugar epimerase